MSNISDSARLENDTMIIVSVPSYMDGMMGIVHDLIASNRTEALQNYLMMNFALSKKNFMNKTMDNIESQMLYLKAPHSPHANYDRTVQVRHIFAASNSQTCNSLWKTTKTYVTHMSINWKQKSFPIFTIAC